MSAFRGNGASISWNNVLSAGTINVAISVNGDGNSSKSLVLVLLSHYPMSWTLDVPSGVIIEKVLLVSVHDTSTMKL